MLTVLFTASTYSHIVNFHLPYLKAFQELGFRVEVGCGGIPMDIPWTDEVFHLPFTKRMTAPENLTAQRLLRARMKARHYDLVCTHTSLAAFFTRRAAAGVRPRPTMVCVAHGYLFDGDSGFSKRLALTSAEKLCASHTDLVLTMNQWDLEEARQHRLGRRVEYIPGIGVDFDHLGTVPREEALALRQELGFNEGDFLLLYAAEFSARKNQPMLLRGLTHLPERVKLLLPGSGGERERCIALAEELGVTDRVRFPGQISQMPLWYSTVDCGVSSSRSEGLPFNIMEGMHYGLPILATRVKGHTDLIQDGVNGLLFPYDDDRAFAVCVQRLLEEPHYARTLGENAARAVVSYDLNAVLPVVMEGYLSVLPDTVKAELPLGAKV